MPPCPFLAVLIDRQLGIAVRAEEPGPLGMFHPHIHAPVLDRQLHPAHFPRGNQSQQMAVQLGVAHSPILPPSGQSTPDPTHGKLRSADCFTVSTQMPGDRGDRPTLATQCMHVDVVLPCEHER